MKGRGELSPATQVVNLRREHYDVYIGRPGKNKRGFFGNPIKVGAKCHACGLFHGRGGTLECCGGKYLIPRLHTDPAFAARVRALQGRRLGCFCAPNACHGDYLAAAADWLVAAEGALPPDLTSLAEWAGL